MSKARRLSLLATAGWLMCFFLLARMYAVAGPDDDRTVLGVVVIVLLVGSGWLTGRAATARRRGE